MALEKAFMWLNAGTPAVVIIDPINHRVSVYRTPRNIVAFDLHSELDLSDIVPGFRVPIRAVFE